MSGLILLMASADELFDDSSKVANVLFADVTSLVNKLARRLTNPARATKLLTVRQRTRRKLR